MKRVVILSLALIALALPLAAQNTGGEDFRGFNGYNAYDLGSFDAVNLDNGNLTLTIPVISYPQKGSLPNLTLDLHYVSQSWYMPCYNNGYGEYCDWLPASTAQTGPVVSFDPQYGTGYRTCSRAACGYPCPCSNTFITDADGGIHNVGNDANNVALDGTGLYYSSSGEVIDRNGIFYCPNCYPTAEKDPSGNTITHNATTFTDSVGRTIPDIAYDMPVSGAHYQPGCTTEDFPIVNGGTAPIEICVSTISYSSSLPSDGYPNVANYSSSVGMITSITLPNSTTWNFSYDSWGELSTVTTPSGGTVSYTWQNMPVPEYEAYVQEDAYYRGVATRVTNANDGTGNKTYTYSATVGGTTYPGMTDPDGNMTVLSNCFDALSAGCVYGTHEYYTPSGGLLKTTQTGYKSAEFRLDVYDPTPSLAYILPNSTATTWPNGLENYVATTYDSAGSYTDSYCAQNGNPCGPWSFPYGSVLEKQEYDYSTSTQPQSSALLRQTSTQFEWQNISSFVNANLLAQPASVIVCDGTATPCSSTSSNKMSQTTYAYDESGRASSCSTTPCGLLTTTNQYINSSTMLTSHTNYNSSNSKGMPTDLYDANGNHACYTYDSGVAYAYLHEIQHPTPNSGGTCSSTLFELFTYDLDTGLLIHHWDENNQETSYSYDSMRRPTSVSYPDGGSESFTYTDSTPPYFNYTKAIKSGTNFEEQGNADGFGREVRTITTVPTSTCSGGYSYVDTTYDNEGRKFTVSNPYCTTTDTAYGLTKTYYDGLNRPILVVPPDGTTPTSSVTCLTNDICPAYLNNCTTVTDQGGNARQSCVDGLGRMTKVLEDPGSSPHLNYETDYTYDTLDNLKTVAQSSSRTRSLSYDWLSRLTSASNPESGTINYVYDSNSSCSSPNSFYGDLVSKTDARSIRTCMQYDALGRVTQKNYNDSGPTPTVSYSYDGTGCLGAPACYNLGRRTGMTDAGGTESWSYDQMGRALEDQRTTNGYSRTFTYAYNYDGSIATLGYPSGHVVTYTPNSAAQPVSAVDSTGTTINYATSAGYTPFGSPASITNSSSLVSTFFYNDRLQPCRMSAKYSGTVPGSCTVNSDTGNVLDLNYNFDLGTADNGNVYKITDNTSTFPNVNYLYDHLNRIQSANSDATTGSLCTGETYTIDSWSNLTGIAASSGYSGSGCTNETLSLGVNGSNQITNTGVYYDSSGNMTNDGSGHSYTYDAESRISAVGSGPNYYYDGDGKRVRKSGGTMYWYGMESEPLLETDSSGNLTNEYVFFGGKRIARRDSSSNIEYYFSDQLGSARVVTNASGGVQESCRYYSYGGSNCSPSTTNDYLFTGKERDSESGLDNFGARYNSSQYGRFMTPDAFYHDSHVADPQSWNEYAYARNNPLRYTDPSGNNATVSTSCTTDSNNQTTCNVNISASIAIYAAPGSGITQDQLNSAASTMQSSIQNAWSGSFTQDGVSYNVSTQVSVSVADSQSAAMGSGAQNVIGMTNGDPAPGEGAFVNPKSLWGALTGRADTGMMDINGADNYAKHEFTHLLGVGDRGDYSVPDSGPAVMSNTWPNRRPDSATGQDFSWGVKEATQSVGLGLAMKSWYNGSGGPLPSPFHFSSTDTVGAPAGPWWK